MTYKVILLSRAEQDLDAILNWLTERSPDGANAWNRRWLQIVEQLEATPKATVFAPENDDHEIDVRQIVFKTRRGLPYRVLFTIREAQVFVFHIRGPGQDVVAPDDLAMPEKI